MQTDPIADMLTRIRNAVTARHTRVDMPASRIKIDIARILQDEGYIQGYKRSWKTTAARRLRLFLKYRPDSERDHRRPALSAARAAVSTLAVDVPDVGGMGTSILTTSRGVMTGRNAVKAGVGGEVLCDIW